MLSPKRGLFLLFILIHQHHARPRLRIYHENSKVIVGYLLSLLPLRILDPQSPKNSLLIVFIEFLTDSPNKFYNVSLSYGLLRTLSLNDAVHVSSIEILSSL
jgi:hypothetical protein